MFASRAFRLVALVVEGGACHNARGCRRVEMRREIGLGGRNRRVAVERVRATSAGAHLAENLVGGFPEEALD